MQNMRDINNVEIDYDKREPDYFWNGNERLILNVRKCGVCKNKQFVNNFYINLKYRPICKSCYKDELLFRIEHSK